jgi:hypothetical protein
VRSILSISLTLFLIAPVLAAADNRPFVRVSPRDPRYFELSDGQPYIPIGLNMIAPPGNGERGMAGMERWFKLLQENHANYVRIWLSNPFFDIEHERSGQYDEEKAKRIDWLFDLARQHDIRLKLCLEHFRHLGDGKQTWAGKALHKKSNGGTAENMADFLDGQASRELFKKKLAWYAKRYGDDPIVYGWELWNEINAVQAGDYMAWTEVMLPELHRLFPKNLCMQSLGSFDTDGIRRNYQRLAVMNGNDVAQVHRYLDLGARLEICHGPVDLLAEAAVNEMLSVKPGKPVILAESGAVEPSHSGPFKLYAKDKDGILLHDILFAPFFAGAAGPGHIWHWDAYVDRNNLWQHFDRFYQTVKDLDPPAEKFQVMTIPHERLRVRVLKGQKTTLIWCRDIQNTWMSELRDGQSPQTISGATIDLGQAIPVPDGAAVRIFDPWANRWANGSMAGTRIVLPDFSRSMVIRIQNAQ